jgi:hypothetical protein
MYYHPNFGSQLFLTPGSSVVLADGTIDFTPGVLMVFPTFAVDSGVLPGYASHARVLLAASATFLGGLACATMALLAAGLLAGPRR